MRAATAKTFEGVVVGLSGDKLTTTCSEGKEHMHTLAKDAKVSCDGNTCKATDLKAGMHVTISEHRDDETVATAVESRPSKTVVSHKN